MTLTREDRLRELELLPVWRLRQPAAQPAPDAQPSSDTRVDEPSPQPLAAESPVNPPVELPVAEDLPLDASRRAAIMAMDWESLRECVSQCQACSLAQTRQHTVFGVGDENADWLFVGEAPGAEEDKRGEPFVGNAGQLLDNMLAAIELKRGENVYIANVLKCRPPENRDPHGEEAVRCDPFLKRQVDLIRPKLIVALGRFAAQSLLDTDASIGSLRGKLHDYQGMPVIVTYHPAYLLRNLMDKSKAWEDLCLARATMRQLQTATLPPSE